MADDDDQKGSLGDILAQQMRDMRTAAGERPPDGPGTAVDQSEIHAAAQMPAVLSNRILATNTASGMRLSFGEQSGPEFPTVFRAAILLSYDDATALRDLINRQLRLTGSLQVKVEADGTIVPLSR